MYISLMNNDSEEILAYGDFNQIKALCVDLIDKNNELEKIKETFENGEGEHESENIRARALIENIEFILQRATTGYPVPLSLDRAINEIQEGINDSEFKTTMDHL